MRVLGLDVSLTATGWCTAAIGPTDASLPWLGVLRPGQRRGVERLSWMRAAVGDLLEALTPDVAVVEGYAYGRPNQAHALGEAGGAVRLALYDAGVPVVVVPPASVKRYATGKGNAAKEAVLAAAIRRLDYDGCDNNEADAAWLAAMALDHYCGAVVVPASHRVALDKITWPNVEGSEA